MIVEDDYIVRLYLKKNIDWEKNNCSVVAEASNGKEALENLAKTPIDIILTDIGMPQMDGITLIKEVRKLYPRIKIVVLSCHSDFIYVKDAMKYGAYDYILKHMMESQNLMDVIDNVRRSATKEEEDRKNLASLKENNTGKNPAACMFIKELLKGKHNIGDAKIVNKLNKLGVNIGAKNIVVMNVEILDKGIFREMVSVEDPELYEFSVLNVICEILSDEDKSTAICFDSDRFIAILSFEDHRSLLNIESQQQSIARNIEQYLERTLKIKSFITVSDVMQDITMLGTAFEQALEASRYKIYKTNTRLIFYKEINKKCLLSGINKEINNFKESLKNSDFEECERILESIFTEVKRLMVSPEDLETIFIELLNAISSYMEKLGFDRKSILGMDVMPYKRIKEFTNIDELFNWYLNVYSDMKKSISSQIAGGYRKEIRAAIDYVNKNIENEITLNDVANYVGISPVYFSQLFKQQTGENFSEYLTRIRIDLAKRLLEDTNLKIYEVAYKAGFSQPQYFIKVFKEVVGMTPLDYRKCSMN